MSALRLAVLTRYESLGASSRIRALQYLPDLERHGVNATVYPLLSDGYVKELYQGHRSFARVMRSYAQRLLSTQSWRAHDVLWVEKELLPMLPFCLESWLLRDQRLVLDFDDAVFHNYDLSPHKAVRAVLGRKIDQLMARADLVTAGNSYLAGRARSAGARWVEQLPSCIDLNRYPTPQVTDTPQRRGSLRLVWIGSPATAFYLDLLREPLLEVASRHNLQLRLIGAGAPTWVAGTSLQVESLPWSAEREVQDLMEADIGVMPLHDSPWEQGKCSFKLVQYMACGLPVIASPVGMNRDVVKNGINGWLASSPAEWVAAIESLAADPGLRQRLGLSGRDRVENEYCIQAQAPRWAGWLKQLARSPASGS